MRYNPNPWQSYRQAATKTATPGQLVLMLFDGALRFLDRALIGFDLDDPLESNLAINNNILKAQDIIRELNASLNMELGGEFSATMRRLYNYYDSQLSKSNLQKDPTGVQRLVGDAVWPVHQPGGSTRRSAIAGRLNQAAITVSSTTKALP